VKLRQKKNRKEKKGKNGFAEIVLQKGAQAGSFLFFSFSFRLAVLMRHRTKG